MLASLNYHMKRHFNKARWQQYNEKQQIINKHNMDLISLIGFLGSYFAGKGLDNLLSNKESIASALQSILSSIQSKYCEGGDVIEDDVKKHHFCADRLFDEGIVKILYGEPDYGLFTLCDELAKADKILRFRTEEVEAVLTEIISMARSNPMLQPTIILHDLAEVKSNIETIMNPGLLVSPEEFIKQYKCNSLTNATPLNNKFFYREQEISEGLDSILNNDCLMITGDAGVGKTRLALEICNKFVETQTDYTLLCLKSFAATEVSSYLYGLLKEGRKILLFIDDANRVGGNYSGIIQYIGSFAESTLKIITTVRSYSHSLIREKTTHIKSRSIEVQRFDKEAISKILQSEDFKVNKQCTDRIYSISKGNARIAIMCAKIAIEKDNMSSLNNVLDLFNEYFDESYKQISESKHLKVLGILSLFRTMNRENKISAKIYETLNLSEDEFWSICNELHERELVDIWENNVVKFSDQTFSTYIHYRIYFKDKLLPYSDVVSHFIEFDDRIKDSLIPVVNNFGDDAVKEVIENCINQIWDESNQEQTLNIIKLYYPFILIKSLAYFKRSIDVLVASDKEYDFNLYTNDYLLSDEVKELGVLASIAKYSLDYTDSALELMVRFVEKTHLHYKLLIDAIKENWKYNRKSHLDNYCHQNKLVDYLVSKQEKNPNDELIARICFDIAGTILSTSINDCELSSGLQYTMYSGDIRSTDGLIMLRNKYWKLLFNFSKSFRIELCKLLSSNSITYNTGKSTEILRLEIPIFVEMFAQNFNGDQFLDCLVVDRFLLKYNNRDGIEVKSPFEFNNHLWNILLLFHRDKKEKWEDELTRMRETLNIHCKDFKIESYIKLYSDISKIRHFEDLAGVQSVPLFYEREVMFAIFHNNIGLAIEIIKHLLITTPQIIDSCIVNSYLNGFNGNADQLIDVIEKDVSEPYRSKWLLEVYKYLTEKDISKANFRRLAKFIESSGCFINIAENELEHMLNKYDKLLPIKKQWNHLVSVMCDKIGQNIPFSLEYECFAKRLDITDNPKNLARVYFYLLPIRKEMSCSNSNIVMSRLLSIDPQYIIEYANTKYADTYIGEYNSDFTFIWDNTNYIDVIDVFEKYMTRPEHVMRFGFDCMENLFVSGLNEEKQLGYLKYRLEKDFDKKDVVKFIFNAIYNCFRYKHFEFIDILLKLTNDIEIFKCAEVSPSSHFYQYIDSIIPLYYGEIERFEKIKEIVLQQDDKLNYIEHIEYVDHLIQLKHQDIKYEQRKKFHRDY